MPRLVMFNSISLDSYFTSSTNDMSWAHRYDPEWTTFISSNASGEAVMAFGRKTYDLMASYWPTPMAAKNNPGVAEAMNKLPKLVFSRTLDKADWSNTKLVKGDPGQRSPQTEASTRQGPGHPRQRHHRLATLRGPPDRRIPNRPSPRSPGRRPHPLRRPKKQAGPEANENAYLRKWKCCPVLRARSLKEFGSFAGVFHISPWPVVPKRKSL
jgi:hypothetical protein